MMESSRTINLPDMSGIISIQSIDMKFKIGDIVFFREEHRSHYTSGYYYHKMGVRYEVLSISGGGNFTATIKNLEDGENHFAFGDMITKLITLDEWRDIQLGLILK